MQGYILYLFKGTICNKETKIFDFNTSHQTWHLMAEWVYWDKVSTLTKVKFPHDYPLFFSISVCFRAKERKEHIHIIMARLIFSRFHFFVLFCLFFFVHF